MALSVQRAAIDATVRAAHYSIAGAATCCPGCGSPTELLALVVPAGHALCAPEPSAPCERRGWEFVPCCAFLFQLERLAPAVERRLGAAPVFTRAGSRRQDWINRCIRCGYQWPDEELFCEPGGAFLPTCAEDALRLRFTAVAAPLWARAGGYAPDPAFLRPRFAR